MMHHDEQPSLDRRLRDALLMTAADDTTLNTSAAVERRLRMNVRADHQARAHRRLLIWVAAAAAIVIAITTAGWPVATDEPAREPGTSAVVEAPPSDLIGADFIPLRYANVPARSGHIVQMVVPVSVMASFGLEPASSTTDVVTADVFVGDDGLARAVRFEPLTTRELSQ